MVHFSGLRINAGNRSKALKRIRKFCRDRNLTLTKASLTNKRRSSVKGFLWDVKMTCERRKR